MTVTEAPRDVVEAPARPAPSPPPTGLAAVVGSGDPWTVGRLFIGTSLLFLLMAGVVAVLVGFERVDLSGFEVLDSDIVRQLFTLQSIAAVFLGHLYGVPLGPAQLLAVSLTALLTSFSTPGVPHGWLLVISPLVVSMGIPAEGIGLLIAVDAVPDMFATTLNVTADMVAAAVVSRRSNA